MALPPEAVANLQILTGTGQNPVQRRPGWPVRHCKVGAIKMLKFCNSDYAGNPLEMLQFLGNQFTKMPKYRSDHRSKWELAITTEHRW
jgi:hypothetical protein